MMKNLNIYAFSDEAGPQIDHQIEALLRNHLQGMEIRGVDGANISDITCDKAREVKAKLEDKGLCVWSIGSPLGKIGITDDFVPHLDKFKHTLELASLLGAKNIRMFSFFIKPGQDPTPFKDEVMDRLARFAEAACGSGIALCHENEKGIYGDTPERCLEIHKTFPEIKAVFDPANFVQCGVNTVKAWELLKNHIHYMHIKDALSDGYIVPAGRGEGNLEKIVGEYIAMGGRHFTIEPHLAVFSGLEALERDGERTKTRISFPDNDTAFDTACNAFKNMIGEY